MAVVNASTRQWYLAAGTPPPRMKRGMRPTHQGWFPSPEHRPAGIRAFRGVFALAGDPAVIEERVRETLDV
jgi:hypothetical protein